MSISAKATALVLFLLAAALSAPAIADPPAHAPAHGWRKKHDPYYVGYTGRQWEHDYDIRSGRCNREAIATVAGGVVGGVIASRVAEPENRTVATIIGIAAGALIGNKIGERLDEVDRGCFGHSLEIGNPGQAIYWTNDSTGVRYEMTPGVIRKENGAACREFTLIAVDDVNRSSRRGVACQSELGVWQIVE